MKSNGLFLKDIPEKEKTEEICKLYHLPKTEGRFIIFYENKYNPLFSKETVEIRYLQFKDEYIIK